MLSPVTWIGIVLMAVTLSAQEDGVKYKLEDDSGKALRLLADGKPIFSYNYAMASHPDAPNPNFTRNAYLHPVWTPSGKVVTDDWAWKDKHGHQRGVWFAWTKTEIGDKKPDFWNIGAGTGKIFFVKFMEKFADGSGFVAEHEWKLGKGNAQYDEVVLREQWTVRGAGKVGDGFLFDVTSLQEAMVPIHLPKHHYGGMAFRGAPEWQPKDAPITLITSEGDDRTSGDNARARWWHAQGKLGSDGPVIGFAMFDAPTNQNHPSPMRLNPEIPYFGFFPFKREAFTIEPKKSIRFDYRMYVHDGDVSASKIEALWQEWVERLKK